jgi:DNA polymerase III epsilon subunit-like protein
MVLRIIDLETTGVDPAEHSIIEIASVDLLQGGRIGNRQSHLVLPGRDIPPEASAVHHLIAADLADAPPLADVIGHYAGADAYIAHSCSFERSFLDQHFGDVPWQSNASLVARPRDALRSATRRDPAAPCPF